MARKNLIFLWADGNPWELVSPNLQEAEYDRISVAYGLAQGTQCGYLWPQEIIKDIVVERHASRGKNFVSKGRV